MRRGAAVVLKWFSLLYVVLIVIQVDPQVRASSGST